MHFGFSYIGLLFLLMLMIPNLIWSRYKPKDYDKYMKNENRILLLLERIGQVSVTCIALAFADFNVNTLSVRSLLLLLAFLSMLLYEAYWIRYFKSGRTMGDFYRSFLGIPLAGAVLPVTAFLILGIYGKNPLLVAAVLILGIGHIGIHRDHKREIS